MKPRNRTTVSLCMNFEEETLQKNLSIIYMYLSVIAPFDMGSGFQVYKKAKENDRENPSTD